jgi:hypothetical protein
LASAPNVTGHDQEPQDKGRDQDSVCPADNDARRGPETQESKSRMSTATDAELVALGERFEKLLLEYLGLVA